jgi:hypothetical protein
LLSILVVLFGTTSSGCSGVYERWDLRRQQQYPTTNPASKTMAATTLATAIAMMLPDDIFDFDTPFTAALLAVDVGTIVTNDVRTVPLIVATC